jgi:hypothetical protein
LVEILIATFPVTKDDSIETPSFAHKAQKVAPNLLKSVPGCILTALESLTNWL